MRYVIYKDKKIPAADYDAHLKKLGAFWKRWLGITPDFWVVETDFSNYEFELDEDGDVRPAKNFLSTILFEVAQKYEKDGTDYVRIHIHEDNWQSSGPLFDTIRAINGLPKKKGIWGTAWAYYMQPYLMTYCRWDRDNIYNSFNTAYHEDLHPWDSLVKVELGIDLHDIVQSWLRRNYADDKAVIAYLDTKGFNWDRDMVHGGLDEVFDYIGRAGAGSNEVVLPIVAPYVRAAFEKRAQRHLEYTRGLQKTAISLLEQVLYWLRRRKNRKSGVTI